MKYLSNYTEDATTALLSQQGAFFAFSTEQFNEAKAPGPVQYVSLYAGMICPKVNAPALLSGLSDITDRGIAADIADNGLPAIIWRELGNHEADITYSIEDTMRALDGYPDITADMVQAVFNKFIKQKFNW